MTMIGYKSQNHPQQTAKSGARDDVDDRGTEQSFVDALAARLGGPFTLDVAAAAHNAKAPAYYTRDDDGLAQGWAGRVWCNPPYSDCGAWVQKAWAEWRRPEMWIAECSICGSPATTTLNGETIGDHPMGPTRNDWPRAGFVAKSHRIRHHEDDGAVVGTRSTKPESIAMLLPANRVEQGWWQDHVEPYRDRAESPLSVEFLRGRMRFDRPGWEKPAKGDRPPFGCCLLIWSRP